MRPLRGLAPSANRFLIAGLTPAVILGVILAACELSSPIPSAPGTDPSAIASASSEPTPAIGQIVPAPGSTSRIYEPNPAAIVVAIDPGHGGCLDWGVPNPYDNTVARSEKTLTLDIGRALRDLLVAEGVTVVMTREDDVALAGDLYPERGCHGDPFRDVNGDGYAGFGPLFPVATRTRDELSAHIDLVNLARADVLVSIHVNSLTEDGVVLEIAATETFWTDETPWGVPLSERLATLVQDEVVTALSGVAPYDRQDRGIDAVNFYMIAPPTQTGDPREPRRGILMPAVLAEVGSMSLEAEADLLATARGQAAIASGLLEALAAWFAERDLGMRMDADQPRARAGEAPGVEPGSGPPYWATAAPAADSPIRLLVTLTNTGQQAWAPGAEVVAGWEVTDDPYLARPPALAAVGTRVPALAPGESVVVELRLPDPPAGRRAVAWISLRVGNTVLSDLGVPAFQIAAEP